MNADNLPRMSDEELRQYERCTAKRPGLCLLALLALPLINEIACRIAGAW